MLEPDAKGQWGNQFGYLHVSVPELTNSEQANPLEFVWKAQKSIKRKRSSGAVYLTAQLLGTLRKLRGPEAVARFIHKTLSNSSMTVSNLIGPAEAMTLANQQVKGLYFMVAGVTQSLTITMVSYVGKLRVAVGTEKGFIDEQKFKAYVEKAFDMIFRAALEIGQYTDDKRTEHTNMNLFQSGPSASFLAGFRSIFIRGVFKHHCRFETDS